MGEITVMKTKHILLLVLISFFWACEESEEDRIIGYLEAFYRNDSLAFEKVVGENAPLDIEITLFENYFFSKEYHIDVNKEDDEGQFRVKIAQENDSVSIRLVFDSIKDKIDIYETGFRDLFFREDSLSLTVSKRYFDRREFNKAYEWLAYCDTSNLNVMLHTANIHYERYEYHLAQPLFEELYNSGIDDVAINLCEIYTTAGQRPRGLKLLKEVAARGNSEAMVRLGDYYETYFSGFGYDPPEDATNQSSYEWYSKAAKLNNTDAMYQLGYIYERGINKQINLDSAYFWYGKSSDLGFSLSSVKMSLFFLEGKHMRIDLDSGMYFVNRAIDQNPGQGYYNLAEIYEKGKGVRLDKRLALKYYIMADSLGDPTAHLRIKKLEGLNINM